MCQSSTPNFDQRLQDLERQNRLIKRVGVFLSFLFGLLLILETDLVRSRPILRVRAIEIQDHAGLTRARLGLGEGNRIGLSMKDGRGRELINLGIAQDQSPRLDFHNKGRLQMSLNSDSVGGSRLEIFDRGISPTASFFHIPGEFTGLQFSSPSNCFSMTLSPDGTPSVRHADMHEDPFMISEIDPRHLMNPLFTLLSPKPWPSPMLVS